MYAQCTVDLFGILIDLAAFDIVPEEYYEPFQQYLLPFKSDYAYSHGFVEIGYESGHMLQSMFFVWSLVALQLAYYAFFYVVYHCAKRMEYTRMRNYAKSCLVDRFSFFQRTLLGCALEIFVTGLIEVAMKQTVGPYETASYYFSVAVLLVALGFCHQIVTVYETDLLKMHDTEKFPIFNNRWGVIWDEIRVIGLD